MSAGTGFHPGEVEMFHPKDVRGRMSRRMLLERAGGLAVAGGFLAACANSTDVKPSGGPVTQAGSVVTEGTGTAEAVPLGPGGIPIATRDRPVKLPLYDNNPPIDAGLPIEDGPLKVYNWADYIDPETVKKFEKQFKTKVEITTFQNEDEAMAKLQSGSVDFDVYFPSLTRLPILVSKQLVRPLTKEYVPNLAGNIWPRAGRPVLRQGRAVRRAVRRVRHRHRLAQRQDHRGHRGHAEPVGVVLGARQEVQGQGRDPRRSARRALDAAAPQGQRRT